MSSSQKPELKLAWSNRRAAEYAVTHWHYSRSLSSARNVYIGVWEGGRFIGVIVFGIGAGNATNGTRYGLARNREVAELTRVALAPGHAHPVSRIVSIAIKMIKKQSPGLRLLISMADPNHGHHGGIYQAMNWVYTGTTAGGNRYLLNGKWVHQRTATSSRTLVGLKRRKDAKKHRYLYPLDDAIRKVIEPMRKPYPKRGSSIVSDAPATKREKAAQIRPIRSTH